MAPVSKQLAETTLQANCSLGRRRCRSDVARNDAGTDPDGGAGSRVQSQRAKPA